MTRRRILIVAPFPPRLVADHGGALVIGRLALELAAANDIAVLCFRTGDEPPVDDRLHERLAFVEYVPRRVRTSSRARAIRAAAIGSGWARGRPRVVSNFAEADFGPRLEAIARSWQPSVVQLEFHLLAQYPSPRGPARVVVVHEPGADAAAAAGGLPGRIDAWTWRRFEREALASADAVVTFTEEDRAAMQRVTSRQVVRIPFGADVRSLPDNDEPPTVLYYGNYSHAPNVAAAERLANAIFPRVRGRFPAARLALAGRAPNRVRLPAGPAVDHLGFVADVGSLLASATVVVAPLETGGGMRVKVAETLAAGKALVASERAMAGIDATPGTHYEAAETDAEFASAIVRLLENGDERKAMEAAAGAFASSRLRWEDTAAAFNALYDRLTAAGQPPNEDE